MPATTISDNTDDDLLTGLLPEGPTRRRAPLPDYSEIIDRHAQRTGLDRNLIQAVIGQESSGVPTATSPKGARGLMQLMPATAQRFGVKNVNDPEENIRGGTDYLKFLSDRYNGDIDKVLAGYNAGEGAVDKFGGIPPYKETRAYVPAIKARYQKLSGQKTQSPKPKDDLASGLVEDDDLTSGLVDSEQTPPPSLRESVQRQTKPATATSAPNVPKGLILPRGQRNQLSTYQPKFGLGQPYKEELANQILPQPSKAVPNMVDVLGQARQQAAAQENSEEGQVRAQITGQMRDTAMRQRGGGVMPKPEEIEQAVQSEMTRRNQTKVEQQRLLNQFTPEDWAEVDDFINHLEGKGRIYSGIRAGIRSGGASGLYKLAGVFELANKIQQPITGQSSWIPDYLRKKALAGELSVDDIPVEKRNQLAEFLAQSGVGLAEVTAAPGGPLTKFGGLAGAEAIGRNKPLPEVAKDVTTGELTGALFKGAEGLAPEGAGFLRRASRTVPAVGAGTGAIELASGASPYQAGVSALSNAAFQAGGELMQGRGRRARQTETQPNVAAQPVEAERQQAQVVPETVAPVPGVSNEGLVQPNQSDNAPPQRYYHKDWGEVTVLEDQSGARRGRVKVAEVDDPSKLHYPKRSDLSGAGNQRMVPIKPEEVPAEVQPEPAVQPSPAEAVNRPAASMPEGAQIPFMITKQMESDLRNRGMAQEDINKLTPQQANDILSAPEPVKPVEQRVEAPKTEPPELANLRRDYEVKQRDYENAQKESDRLRDRYLSNPEYAGPGLAEADRRDTAMRGRQQYEVSGGPQAASRASRLKRAADAAQRRLTKVEARISKPTQAVEAPATEPRPTPPSPREGGAGATRQFPELREGENYRRPLKDFTDKLYRETSVGRALEMLPSSPVYSDITHEDVYMANSPDLALGQGANKGVKLEFDSGELQGKVNKSKPAWKPLYDQGQAEFVGRLNKQADYQSAVRAVTVRPDAEMSRVEKSQLNATLGRLEKQGWTKTETPEGVRYERPAEVRPQSEQKEVIPTEGGVTEGGAPPSAEYKPLVEDDLRGIKKSYASGEINDAEFAKQEEAYYADKHAQEQAQEARENFLMEGRGAELFDKVRDRTASYAEHTELSKLAKEAGLDDAELRALIAGARAEAEPQTEGLEAPGRERPANTRPTEQLGFVDEGLTAPEGPRPKEPDQREQLRQQEIERQAKANPERAEAQRELEEIRRRGLTVDEYARQGNLFGEKPTPERIKLLRQLEGEAPEQKPEEPKLRFGPGAAAKGDVPLGSSMKQLADAVGKMKGKSARESIDLSLGLADKYAQGKDAISRGLLRLKAMSEALTTRPEYTDYKRNLGEFLFRTQQADHETRMFAKSIKRQIPSSVRRNAITDYIQAGGDLDLLKERAEKSEGRTKAGYEQAQNLTDEEKTVATNISSYFESRLEEGRKAGIISGAIENYVNQLWKRPNPVSKKLMADVQRSILDPNFNFGKNRVFESYFEGEQAGYRPVTKDIGELVSIYNQSFDRAIASRQFIQALHDAKASDGRPLVEIAGSGAPVPKGEESPEAYLIYPKTKPENIADYKTIDHPALRGWKWATSAGKEPIILKGDMLVHPDAFGHLKNVLGTSAFNKNVVGRAVKRVQTSIKQTMLSLSGFHQVQEGVHALGHRVSPSENVNIPGFAKLERLNFDDPKQAELIKGGLQVASFDAMQEFGEGITGGNLVNKIPILGRKVFQPYQEWLFRDYIPRLKVTMASHAFDRNLDRYEGKLSREQIAELTAEQANAAFGELNYRYMGRNQTVQDALRTFLLAPDFLEARGRFVGQAFKPHGREQLVALGLLAATQYLTARIINKFTDDDYHFEPENAFRVIYNKHWYGMRTVPADILHLISDPRGFIYYRLSPAANMGITAITGRDERGQKIDAADQIHRFLKYPLPIAIRKRSDDRWWEPFINSMGVQEGKSYSPAEEMMLNYFKNKLPAEQMADEEKERSLLKREYVRRLREGESPESLRGEIQKDTAESQLRPKDQRSILREGAQTRLQTQFQKLPIKFALDVYDTMTPAEKKEVLPYLRRKGAGLYSLPLNEQKDASQRWRADTGVNQ